MDIRAEDLVGPEWAEWYSLTPAKRMEESGKLWPLYLALGGSLDPEPDPQSPFFDPDAPSESTSHGRVEVELLPRFRRELETLRRARARTSMTSGDQDP
jgi:hypothetical protein